MLVFNWLKSGIPEGTVILRRYQESVEMIFPRFHDRAKKFNWRPVVPIWPDKKPFGKPRRKDINELRSHRHPRR
jgi:hypothetical protein